MQGKIIVFEGIDGSGKSTQTGFLIKSLQKNRKKFSLYKFPQYEKTFHGRTISRFLKGEFGSISSVSSHLIALAYAMDRATAKESILQDLKSGKIVICDRYVYSSGAYQGAKFPPSQQRKFLDWLEELEYKENKIPKEDLNIFLDAPVNVSFELQSKQGKKKDIFEEAVDFLERVRETYLKLAKDKNWVVVKVIENDQLRSPESIHQEILSVLRQKQIL